VLLSFQIFSSCLNMNSPCNESASMRACGFYVASGFPIAFPERLLRQFSAGIRSIIRIMIIRTAIKHGFIN